MEKLLDDALDIAFENFEAKNEWRYSGKTSYGYFSSGVSSNGQVARLRLDFELAESASNEVPKVLIDLFRSDLLELLEDGDVKNYKDPLLNSMDGAKVKGKEPEIVDIFRAQLFIEYKPKKKTNEYTLFLLMYTEF